MKTIGIIGCGAIGKTLVKHIKEDLLEDVSKIAIYDVDQDVAVELAGKVESCSVSFNIDEVIQASDLVIEAAVGACVPDLLSKVIDAGKDLMVMSIGEEFWKKWAETVPFTVILLDPSFGIWKALPLIGEDVA